MCVLCARARLRHRRKRREKRSVRRGAFSGICVSVGGARVCVKMFDKMRGRIITLLSNCFLFFRATLNIPCTSLLRSHARRSFPRNGTFHTRARARAIHRRAYSGSDATGRHRICAPLVRAGGQAARGDRSAHKCIGAFERERSREAGREGKLESSVRTRERGRGGGGGTGRQRLGN